MGVNVKRSSSSLVDGRDIITMGLPLHTITLPIVEGVARGTGSPVVVGVVTCDVVEGRIPLTEFEVTHRGFFPCLISVSVVETVLRGPFTKVG